MSSIVVALKNYKRKTVDTQKGACPSANPYKPVKIC